MNLTFFTFRPIYPNMKILSLCALGSLLLCGCSSVSVGRGGTTRDPVDDEEGEDPAGWA